MPTPDTAMTRLDLTTARALVEAALDQATAQGLPIAVAVVDAGGNLLAFARDEAAAFLTGQIAQQKAITAAGSGMSGQAWADFLAADGVMRTASAAIDRLLPLPGAVPLTRAGLLLGGIGVSGGHHSQDHAIAQHAATLM